MELKVGDRVKIIGNTSGHHFDIGDEVVLSVVDYSDNYFLGRKVTGGFSWCFGEDECVRIGAKNNREAAFILDREY